MTPEVTTALIGLMLTVIGVLTALVEKVRRDLDKNTEITKEAKESANGTLRETLERLASERNRTLALREIVREREDRLAYIIARHPEVEPTIREYRDRRSQRVTEEETAAAERAVLSERR